MNTTNDIKFFEEVVQKGLRVKLDQLYTEELSKILVSFEKQRATIVNQLLVDVAKHVNYDVIGETISVRIIKK